MLISYVPLSPVVGRYYNVRHVKIEPEENVASLAAHTGFVVPEVEWLPVVGPVHDDPEIGFPYRHIHLDFRFLELNLETLHIPRAEVLLRPYVFTSRRPAQFTVLPKKCRQILPDYPGVTFQYSLEETYAETKVVGNRCPHKGLPLSAGKLRPDGSIQCAGHGLCWRQGSLQRQTP